MDKKARSWSKPSNLVGLIGRKHVDWSIFIEGSHIPINFIKEFEEANDNIHINLNEKYKISLTVNGKAYDAELFNIDRKDFNGDTLQLLYRPNTELKNLLKQEFQISYSYLVNERSKLKKGERKSIITPDSIAEYMDFYATNSPFEYAVKLIKAGQNKLTRKIRVEHLTKVKGSYETKEKMAAKLPYEELEKRAKKVVSKSSYRRVFANQYNRNPFVSVYAKKKAKGRCQLCNNEAPFKDKEGNPYLETHHIVWLSQGGEDTIYNTVALCPNCHRKLHLLNDQQDIKTLKEKIDV